MDFLVGTACIIFGVLGFILSVKWGLKEFSDNDFETGFKRYFIVFVIACCGGFAASITWPVAVPVAILAYFGVKLIKWMEGKL